MDALVFFEERLPGFDRGQPVGGEYSGFDVRVLRFNGRFHLEVRPAAAGGDPDQGPDRRYVAVLTANQARALIEGVEQALDPGAS